MARGSEERCLRKYEEAYDGQGAISCRFIRPTRALLSFLVLAVSIRLSPLDRAAIGNFDDVFFLRSSFRSEVEL